MFEARKERQRADQIATLIGQTQAKLEQTERVFSAKPTAALADEIAIVRLRMPLLESLLETERKSREHHTLRKTGSGWMYGSSGCAVEVGKIIKDSRTWEHFIDQYGIRPDALPMGWNPQTKGS